MGKNNTFDPCQAIDIDDDDLDAIKQDSAPSEGVQVTVSQARQFIDALDDTTMTGALDSVQKDVFNKVAPAGYLMLKIVPDAATAAG